MKHIKNIFVREILRLKSRSSAWVLIIFIPVIIFLYLGAIYEEGAVQVVEVGVLDNDKSPFSQQVVDNIQASPKIELVKVFSSEDRLEDIFVSHPEIKGVYYIPENFSMNIMQGKQQKLIVYTNSSNIIYGNLLYKEAATFINTLSAKITLSALTIKGIPYEKAIKMVMPVKTQTRALFNPHYNYLYYLVPGLTTVLLQMIVFFLATRSINSEFKSNSFQELWDLSGGSIFKIIFAKLLTYTVIGMMIAMLIFAFIHPILGIPSGANTLSFMWVILIFVITNATLGLMISILFKDQAIAMDVAFVYNSPAFVFSGFTFPIIAMPAFNSWYANLIPYTHFLKAYIKGIEMSSPFSFLIPQVIALLLFTLFAYVVSVIGLMFHVKKIES
ncbi:ABC transporter permease [Lutimonas halocynthiae]|uniref:ABC transporter permease n=1 Tax=Lutimonas halocynthiae TaxID=1446477 RepID=UPI0025B37FDE|nr:ABC transporter permease [Lutimonas halocynthiae]MDN3642097.1 ABC transporter permease [Lutimonas halocynthiae]